MKSWNDSKSFIGKINTLSIEDYAASVNNTETAPLPQHLSDWLGRLRLLYGMPFDYLVPDERLLPTESIRFFYIDRNWTDRMVDGALSVGKTTSREFAHHHAVFNQVANVLDDEERHIRSRLRDPKSSNSSTGTAADMTGFLLRSQVVAGWTGLEVKAYRGATALLENQLTLLRMDRLGPDILLCLFDGIPDIVDIEEPREGIQFGIDVNLDSNSNIEGDADTPSGFTLKMRHMTGDHAGYEVGWKEDGNPIDNIATSYETSVPVRKANPQVLHIAALKEAIATTLGEIKAADSGDNFEYEAPLTAAEFSVQMLQFPYQQRFQGKGQPAPLDNMPVFDLLSQYSGATIGITTGIAKLSDEETAMLTEEAFGPRVPGGVL
jgi:hypothetical protein